MRVPCRMEILDNGTTPQIDRFDLAKGAQGVTGLEKRAIRRIMPTYEEEHEYDDEDALGVRGRICLRAIRLDIFCVGSLI